MTFQGILTALITPFQNNKIDFRTVEKLLKKQAAASINSVIIGGSTGEGNSLESAEYYELINHITTLDLGATKIIASMTGVRMKYVYH